MNTIRNSYIKGGRGMIKKSALVVLVLAVLVSIGVVFAATQQGEDALNKLMSGNKRFVSCNPGQKDVCDTRRKELEGGQHPFAIVVTCSDSRVAPGIVFDEGLGDIFVVRVAGNVLDPIALGSIEYAAEHLHAPLLILMGHDKCGAVAAAMDANGEPEGNIGAILKKIMPAVKKAKAKGGSKDEMLNTAIRENVSLSYDAIRKQSPVLHHLIEKGELKVVAGIYHLASGEVEILPLTSPRPAPQPVH
jgi:carbonic anhydrase